MKTLLLPCLLALCVLGWRTASPPNRSFIAKVHSECNVDGFKLALLPHQIPNNYKPFPCTYEQDKLFSGYSQRERIEILYQLLQYEGDTSLCSKRVCRYGYTDSPYPQTKYYTTQVDALYLLTILAVGGFASSYCPYPVLIDTVSGREIDPSSEKIAEVFAIYKAWFEENKKRGFKHFPVPLRNSRYKWYGIRKSRSYILNDTFSIPSLDKAFAVVGVCLD
jgi:hypothetical protein